MVVLAGILLPAAAGAWFCQSVSGAIIGAYWGGFVRLAAGHQIIWAVNSVCHFFGRPPPRHGLRKHEPVAACHPLIRRVVAQQPPPCPRVSQVLRALVANRSRVGADSRAGDIEARKPREGVLRSDNLANGGEYSPGSPIMKRVPFDHTYRAPYPQVSRAVRCGDLIFTSGQLDVDGHGRLQHEGDLQAETRRSLSLLYDAVGASGGEASATSRMCRCLQGPGESGYGGFSARAVQAVTGWLPARVGVNAHRDFSERGAG